MTASHAVMVVLAAALGLLAGLGSLRLLRATRRRASVHADLPAAPSTPAPAAPRLAAAAPVLPTAPLMATVHYTDAKGESSVREVVIHSRTLKEERSHGLNIREGGDTTPKLLLIERISRLEHSVDGEHVSLTSAVLIRELLEQAIPLKAARQARSGRPAPQPRQDPKLAQEQEQAKQTAPAAIAAPAPRPEPVPLASLLPEGALGFAVIDLETTGFGAEHRILEIAVIRLEPDGQLRDVWETLVHPGMPIPRGKAQQTHRIHDRMVENAPSFKAVAAELAARLDGHVLVAHNLPFDQGFLERRFAAVEEIRINLGTGLNTMQSRESLKNLCLRLDVDLPPEEAHSALVDARALQQALLTGISHLQTAGAAVRVEHNGTAQGCALQPRSAVQSAPGQGAPGREEPVQPGPTPAGWSQLAVPLTAGSEFIKTDVPDASAEALATRLGLIYRQAQKVPVRRRPAFLLAEDLYSTNTKMREAKQRGLPVLLHHDLKNLSAGDEAMGWVFGQGDGEAEVSN